jgi:hypothetical protein
MRVITVSLLSCGLLASATLVSGSSVSPQPAASAHHASAR